MGVTLIKIKKASIHGFGKWVDYTIDFSAESLRCIYGENESGKSTLQHFILFILFGLPPKQRNFFRPKTSGKMGGRLTITDPEVGDFIIERMDEVKNGAATCYTSDGEEHDEIWLKNQLKGMTREVYRSIFTFSSMDLKDFHLMKDDDLGEVILGIGLTGSSNIYELERRLDNKIGELFKPTGKVPLINKQLDVLDKYFTELTLFKNNETTYGKKRMELSDFKNRLELIKTNLQLEKKRQLTLERKLNNIQLINDYHTYHQQLAQYPSEIDFPEEGLERLNELKEKILPLKSERSILKSNLTRNEAEQLELKERLAIQDIYEDAQGLLKDKEHYRLTRMEHSKQIKAVENLTSKLAEDLSDLDLNISLEDLCSISFPFYLEQSWNELKSKVETQKITREQLDQEKNAIEKQQSQLTRQEDEISKKLLTQKEITMLHQRIDLHKEQNFFQRRNKESDENQIHWGKIKVKKNKKIKTILMSSVLFGLIIGVVGFMLDATFLYSVMLLAFIIGLGQYVWGKQSIKETTDLLMKETQIEGHLPIVTDEEKEVAELQLQDHDENKYTLASITDRMKSLNIQYIKWTEKNNSLNQQEKNVADQIDEQINIYPFLSEIELIYWPELYYAMKKLIDLNRTKTINLEHERKLKEQLSDYEKAVENFLITKMDDKSNQDIDLQLTKIESYVTEYQNNQFNLKQTEEKQSEIIKEINEIEQSIKVYDLEINKLFTMAQVDHEDAFYKQAKQLAEKKLTQANLTKSLKSIQVIFSQSDSDKLIEKKPDYTRLEVNLEETISRIKELEQQTDTMRHKIAELNIDLNQMESSEAYSNAVHAFAIEKERLAKLADEWAILKVAKEMLAETKRRYRNTYLTKVIDKTSDYFKHITANRYLRVIAPMNEKPFQVETRDQMRYDINELSKGTVDQLYICLRIAISEIMSEKHHVPFIIDDAFVHFDRIRTQRMLDILMEISQRQQVIYFTCKKETLQFISKSCITYLSYSD